MRRLRAVNWNGSRAAGPEWLDGDDARGMSGLSSLMASAVLLPAIIISAMHARATSLPQSMTAARSTAAQCVGRGGRVGEDGRQRLACLGVQGQGAVHVRVQQ